MSTFLHQGRLPVFPRIEGQKDKGQEEKENGGDEQAEAFQQIQHRVYSQQEAAHS
jgi:hypothetical protein